MKKFIIFILLLSVTSVAQGKMDTAIDSLPINKKNNCKLRYLYFPNMQIYFDQKNMVYLLRKRIENNYIWIESVDLPMVYSGYSLYNGKYVVIDDYDDDDILSLFEQHKKIYPYFKSNTRVSK